MSCLGEKPRDCECSILFLDDTEITVGIKTNRRGLELLDRAYGHLNLIEKDYFGLRYLDETNQTHWLDEKKTIGAQLTFSPTTLYFGVKYYVADPCKLKEELTRYQFFLQIKRDILQGRLPLSFDIAAELSAFALQSELGDYDPKRHPYSYVSELRFVPNQTEELENKINHIHKKLVGHTPSSAEYRYLDKAKWLDLYGVDLHPVLGDGNVEYFLGLTPTGIVVYKNKNKMGNYFWPRISKVSHKGRVFLIKARDKNNEDTTHSFETTTKQACKHLWKCCVEHHTFFRLSQASDSTGKLVSLGSRRKYSSGNSDVSSRSAQITRRPSKRYTRRTSVPSQQFSSSEPNGNSVSDSEATRRLSPEKVKVSANNRKSDPGLNASTNHSAKSAPWESTSQQQGGLYTSGRGSPQSVHSERLKFPRRIPSGSESESGHARRRGRRSRKSALNYNSDSHLTVTSSRRRRYAESGSESDASAYHRRHWAPDRDGYAVNGNLKSNGSMQSLGSESSALAAARRRRKRSRSPGNRRPPAELAEHFKYIDPGEPGMSEDLMRDIPYTNIETRAEAFHIRYYSPHIRHRHRSPKRRSTGDVRDEPQPDMPAEEPPPPYTVGPTHDSLYPGQMYDQPPRGREELKSPVAVYTNETFAAPILKTKEVRSNSLPRHAKSPMADQPRLSPSKSTGAMTSHMGSPPADNHTGQVDGLPPHAREDSGLGGDQEVGPNARSTSGMHLTAFSPIKPASPQAAMQGSPGTSGGHGVQGGHVYRPAARMAPVQHPGHQQYMGKPAYMTRDQARMPAEYHQGQPYSQHAYSKNRTSHKYMEGQGQGWANHGEAYYGGRDARHSRNFDPRYAMNQHGYPHEKITEL